ncbi:alpha-L-rhamnosidase [Chitinophaga agri]|uniref:alpha-L-rhamnosidase n=2 Tax=Chitinophaga agri TaxID=2703787 RepID=A0A6B9ZEL9_9BACT|nr:alpha-L-rhamnosidase [Chitinophaga agri]
MKFSSGILLFTLSFLYSSAQQTPSPSSLRVDLLLHADRVYDQGLLTDLSLEQARLSGGKLQFCQVNSRFPVFSWVISAKYQSACQVLVASRPQLLTNDVADIWNSGRIESDRNIGLTYRGTPLQPATVYYWKTRYWDNTGKASAYSDIRSFCTGAQLEDAALPSFVLRKTHQVPTFVKQVDTSTLYDFGKDGFGQIKLSVNAPHTNDTLIIHLGEALTPDGHINRTPPGTVRYRMIKLPLRQGLHSYQPAIPSDKRNTEKNAILMPADIGEVLPFRYAEITTAKDRYTTDSVSRYLVTSDFDEEASTFTCSDSSLNTLWDLCKYTVKATSFTGYYVDGDRERIPYEADALINQLSHYATDAEFVMNKRTLDYLIYHPTWPTEWSLQNVLIAWYDYLYSGDLQLVRKLYPALKAKLLSDLAREDGLISTRTGKQTPQFLAAIHYTPFNANPHLKDIVDWPPPGFGGPAVAGETDGFVFSDYNAVVNAYYYAALEAMAKLAKALGHVTEANYYSIEAARVHKAFQYAFFDAQTNLVRDGELIPHSSLHANFFALAFGLVPKEKVAPVLAFIHSRGMACSVYGAQFLLDGLSSCDDAVYAQQLLTSTEKRSWLNMLREGATMTMEAWGQSYKPNQDWNHAWGTAPANYIVRHLAGIQPLTAGYATVLIRPQPGAVAQVSMKQRTIRGDIEVRFENQTGHFILQLTLPGNTNGRVCLPFNSADAQVKMDGKIIKAVYKEGYYQIDNVSAGQHLFDVHTNPQ